jgi:hypothetical protein
MQREASSPPWHYWLIPLTVAAVRAIPFLLSRLTAPWPGFSLPPIGYNPTDWFAYVAFIRQAAETGNWLLVDPFTTLPQAGHFLLPLFSALGWWCRWTGADPFWTLELSRIPVVFCFFWMLWRFLGPFIPAPEQRFAAAVLVAFSGGFEGLAYPVASALPERQYVNAMEALSDLQGWSTFASLNNPLWGVGLSLALLALAPLMRPEGMRRPRDWGQLGLGLLASYLAHPYSGVAALAAIVLVLMVRSLPGTGRKPLAYALGVMAGLLPALAVIAAVSRWQNSDEVYRSVARQFFGDYPLSVFWYPVTLGGVGVLACYGWREWAKTGRPLRTEVGAWLAALVFLHTSPLWNGHHFVFHLHIPLCILAAGVFTGTLSSLWRRGRWGRVLATAMLVAIFHSTVTVTYQSAKRVLAYQVPEDALAAIRLLAKQPPGAVYTSERLGTLIPALTPHRVYAGHWFMTPEHRTKAAHFRALLQSEADPQGLVDLVKRERIQYVLLPPAMPAPVLDALRPLAAEFLQTNNFTLLFLAPGVPAEGN